MRARYEYCIEETCLHTQTPLNTLHSSNRQAHVLLMILPEALTTSITQTCPLISMAECIVCSASVTYLFHLQAGTFFSKSSSISAADRLQVSLVIVLKVARWTGGEGDRTHPLVSGMYSHMRIHMGTEKAPYTKPARVFMANSRGGVA